MKYIFEDNGNDVFSTLFKYSYPETISSEFIYAKGAAKIKSLAEPLLTAGEHVIVFMDLVPDNKELFRVYDKLCRLSKEYSYRLVIIPIPCIEYEFILSVQSLVCNKFVSRCINYLPYNDLVNEFRYAGNITTFEKYCKAVVKEKMLPCMSTDSGRSKVSGVFFNTDCDNGTVLIKSADLVEQFPLVPTGVSIEFFKNISGQAVWDIHRECVDMYNDAVNRFRAKGIKSTKIWYIK